MIGAGLGFVGLALRVGVCDLVLWFGFVESYFREV